MTGVGVPPGRAMSTEDVRDLQPVTRHGPAPRLRLG
jgi:hypothetical protein